LYSECSISQDYPNADAARRHARGNVPFTEEDRTMSMYLGIGPVIALIAGVLILIVPRLLNYIVAIYLIVIGIIGLFGVPGLHYRATNTTRVHHQPAIQQIALPAPHDSDAFSVAGD
jgi:hypothetical protein